MRKKKTFTKGEEEGREENQQECREGCSQGHWMKSLSFDSLQDLFSLFSFKSEKKNSETRQMRRHMTWPVRGHGGGQDVKG